MNTYNYASRFPLKLSAPLSSQQFEGFLKEMVFKGFKWDVQIGDHCAILKQAILIDHQSATELYSTAENLWKELRNIEDWIVSNNHVLSELGLPRRLVSLLREMPHVPSLPRIARFDFHYTTDGWKISEVNSDVPGGYIEAAMLPRLWPESFSNCTHPGNPAAAYIESLLPYLKGVVGLLHASWFSDDRQHMEFLKNILGNYGIESLPVSPAQIRFQGNKTSLNNIDLSHLIRFFPCEWFLKTSDAHHWFSQRDCHISNPLSSVVSQTKRMPLIWKNLPFAIPFWRKFLPETNNIRLKDFVGSRNVLKPSLGRMGEGISLPDSNGQARNSVSPMQLLFMSNHWVSQSMFHTVNIGSPEKPSFPCLGVYVVDGKAGGIYGRISTTPLIDKNAADAAVFIEGK